LSTCTDSDILLLLLLLLQMPLFALCQGSLKLPEMEALYLQELAVASAAAKGEYKPKAGEGDHKPPKQ
jgi:fructose-bisphosphate aldolase class I